MNLMTPCSLWSDEVGWITGVGYPRGYGLQPLGGLGGSAGTMKS